MPTHYDVDTINQLNAEEREYQKDINQKKNVILNMTNPTKKQEKWNELFPIMPLDNEWMHEAKYF